MGNSIREAKSVKQFKSRLIQFFTLKQKIVKDTHKENTPSNKTKEFMKTMNMRIREISALNQLFIRGFYTEIRFSKRLSS